jgi:hypothetical protein
MEEQENNIGDLHRRWSYQVSQTEPAWRSDGTIATIEAQGVTDKARFTVLTLAEYAETVYVFFQDACPKTYNESKMTPGQHVSFLVWDHRQLDDTASSSCSKTGDKRKLFFVSSLYVVLFPVKIEYLVTYKSGVQRRLETSHPLCIKESVQAMNKHGLCVSDYDTKFMCRECGRFAVYGADDAMGPCCGKCVRVDDSGKK